MIQFFPSPNSENLRVTNNQVVSAYNQLIKLKMYDDALLIQLLYSLAISLANLSLLKHENVDKQGFISYTDIKTRRKSKIYLDDKIVCFMFKYIYYKGKDDPYFSKKRRKIVDDKCENGTFIVNQTEKNIYKRFNRQFGGKLKFISFTPNDIVKLNKLRVHESKQIKHSVPIEMNRIENKNNIYW